MRLKKCKACGEKFQPSRPLQYVCSPICAYRHIETEKAKKRKRETRKAKQALKSRSEWLREAQAAFNRYIRLRDKDLPCVSCGRHHSGQYHAGHYRSVGSAPELRFCEIQVHKQCQPCNNHLSGNLIPYRVELIRRIGIDAVEWIEGPHDPKKYTIDEIKAIKAKYTKMARELERG